MSRIVVDLNDRRPVWAIPDWAVEEIRGALPGGWSLWRAATPADGSGDGVGGAHPEVLEAIRGATVYIGFGIPAAVLREGRESLEWVHSAAAGVGGSLHREMRESRVRFTNSAGIHGPPMAETVLGMLLHFYRGLDFAVEGKGRAEWSTGPFFDAATPVRELGNSTVGILGYGGIGREVARRLRPLGTRVLGLRRRPPEETGPAEGPADPASASPAGNGEEIRDDLGVELLHGEEGLARLLRESEALVVTVPETPATRGLLHGERLRALPPGALLVNVARGGIVDEEALLELLEAGHLRGAALDVFATEPLPGGSPLWRHPRVLITPHVSAVSRAFWRREVDLVVENFQRLLEGNPLLNEVDRDAGY
jgi:phosphoglycerate dehydrogenase-like enzyme